MTIGNFMAFEIFAIDQKIAHTDRQLTLWSDGLMPIVRAAHLKGHFTVWSDGSKHLPVKK
jgi:hypothetical protein